MRSYEPKHRKALYVRAGIGFKPPSKSKVIRRIRPISKIRNKAMRTYALQSRLWKLNRLCECHGLRDTAGKLICRKSKPHPCEHVHHQCGRVGDLLLKTETWIAVCAHAHRFIHEHPAEARAWGLIKGPWNHQAA